MGGLVPNVVNDEGGSYQGVVGEVPRGFFGKALKHLGTRGESGGFSYVFHCSSLKSPECKADLGL